MRSPRYTTQWTYWDTGWSLWQDYYSLMITTVELQCHLRKLWNHKRGNVACKLTYTWVLLQAVCMNTSPAHAPMLRFSAIQLEESNGENDADSRNITHERDSGTYDFHTFHYQKGWNNIRQIISPYIGHSYLILSIWIGLHIGVRTTVCHRTEIMQMVLICGETSS